ncbi:hypothetical protein I302_107601 [Kwoniella bestiolae CBS 10118]|uniref:Uncharacterized protein n=1 Tax=Kwoniella bestiolae CBS 10118 TaxID=1296100 RepID=A0A1B9FY27_9TREE|nr:hypothetical protein I302_06660 [Kwoniella bestiolae CBS 10118]OCF23677.1 hypothetical protein I302_06660 [Kwoniella bestiolae CBS 10118]
MGRAGGSDANIPQEVDRQRPFAAARDSDSTIDRLASYIDHIQLDTSAPIALPNGPITPPDASLSSGGSVSSTEVNDHLTPLPKGMTSHERPAFNRKNSFSPRLSAQHNFSSPPLPSLSELLVSPPIPDDYDQGQSYFPPFSQHSTSSTQHSLASPDPGFDSSLSVSTPRTPSDHGLPIKAASDSGTFALARRTSKNRSPRIKNMGGVLAPHGSFTSSRSRSSTVNSGSSRSSLTTITSAVTDPQSSASSHEMDPKEREKLFKAASKGDQLAMHRLGWRPPKMNHRHTLGSTEDIWGGYQPPSSTRRSSGSSQASLPPAQPIDQIASSSNSTAIPRVKSYTQSDLFSDAVNLTLRSNALTKNRNPNPTTSNATPRKPPRKGSG